LPRGRMLPAGGARRGSEARSALECPSVDGHSKAPSAGLVWRPFNLKVVRQLQALNSELHDGGVKRSGSAAREPTGRAPWPYGRLGPIVVKWRACCLKMPPCLFHQNPGCFAKGTSTVYLEEELAHQSLDQLGVSHQLGLRDSDAPGAFPDPVAVETSTSTILRAFSRFTPYGCRISSTRMTDSSTRVGSIRIGCPMRS